MKKIILIIVLSILSVSVSVSAKKFDPPSINVEKAIALAKEHIVNKSISDSEKYIIQKVEFLNIYNEYEAAHWNVRYERIPRIKGGWFEIKIYNDGSIKTYYGE